jgi:small-conductance mechanosensitive channel
VTTAIREAAAEAVVSTEPAPKCLLSGFGESSNDLEERFWINDPEAGVNAAAPEVLVENWTIFREKEISIPFRQTDVHLTAREPIGVHLADER